jgi:CRP/FNR family transcriptional regulator, cyclic AMP receptor protein
MSDLPSIDREKDDILAHHYLSLATLYYSRGRISEAIDLLELCKSKNENLAKCRFLLGKIFCDKAEHKKAIEEFLKANELDPFSEDTSKYLGILRYEIRELRSALENFVDAYILSAGADASRTAYYQRQIRALYNEFSPEDKNQYGGIFEDRRKHFLKMADALAASKESESEKHEDRIEQFFLSLKGGDRNLRESARIASELRKFPNMQEFTEDELDAIAGITTRRNFNPEEVIFREDDSADAVFLVESGTVRIVKATPFGEQILAILTGGEFLGEMDLIDSLKSSANAIASSNASLFSIDKSKLEEMFVSWKHLAIRFHWEFYKTLARRIREANELLKSFFSDQISKEKEEPDKKGSAAEAASIDFERKVALLREKGLSSKELRLLATISNEQSFKAGQIIFQEGEAGDNLYIVADGQVRISKHIPGIGEEALAILEKGDFFGEMAVIDDANRSADAKAHTDVTVLPIDRKLLTECLSRDEESSYEFLTILCKILSHRLREINLKIYQWRMLSGGF